MASGCNLTPEGKGVQRGRVQGPASTRICRGGGSRVWRRGGGRGVATNCPIGCSAHLRLVSTCRLRQPLIKHRQPKINNLQAGQQGPASKVSCQGARHSWGARGTRQWGQGRRRGCGPAGGRLWQRAKPARTAASGRRAFQSAHLELRELQGGAEGGREGEGGRGWQRRLEACADVAGPQ